MKEAESLLFALLRSAVVNIPLDAREKEQFDNELLAEMYEISKAHDIAHLLFAALKKNNLIEKDGLFFGELQNDFFLALHRAEQFDFALNGICNALSEGKIPHIPLKGAVIYKLYPEHWMRVSCDIDVLVKGETLDNAVEFLTSQKGYTYIGKGAHDVSLLSPNGMPIELHYELMEKGRVNSASSVLGNVWNNCTPLQDAPYCFEMSNELLYFYHIAHMAKHFEIGGCGIKPFLDLAVMKYRLTLNFERTNTLMKNGGLTVFEDFCQKLCLLWFGKSRNIIVPELAVEFILTGGVYGTSSNKMFIQQQKYGGRFRYIMSKIFIPYDIIRYHYPVLEKYRFLTPLYEVVRWFKLIFREDVRESIDHISKSRNTSDNDMKKVEKMLKELELI